MIRPALLCVAFCALGLPAQAHELLHRVAPVAAWAVELRYSDGQPLAFEAYEIYPVGATVPSQVGRTDAQGRALFVPQGQGVWRIRAFSADGHGVDRSFSTTAEAGAVACAEESPNRNWRLLLGGALLLALFALLQRWSRKKP